MTVAYNHIRIAPTGELAQVLMEKLLGKELADGDEPRSQINSFNAERGNFKESNELNEIIGLDEVEEVKELLPIGTTRSSMLAASYIGHSYMDIGTIQIEGHLSPPLDLQTEEKEILSEMHSVLRRYHVTRRHIQFAPS